MATGSGVAVDGAEKLGRQGMAMARSVTLIISVHLTVHLLISD